ncbi:hypothetical protein SAMN04488563_6146 [Jiangella alkaliphila]|uniref:Uncharacterized protein n=1 Tax=Jiangella alkaliphila TaxID=419479 RepID=A0A1H2LGV7_9ACTN|nr:hypothetical protein SAMN04488563_6146 [Jiangella alkaliphila]
MPDWLRLVYAGVAAGGPLEELIAACARGYGDEIRGLLT